MKVYIDYNVINDKEELHSGFIVQNVSEELSEIIKPVLFDNVNDALRSIKPESTFCRFRLYYCELENGNIKIEKPVETKEIDFSFKNPKLMLMYYSYMGVLTDEEKSIIFEDLVRNDVYGRSLYLFFKFNNKCIDVDGRTYRMCMDIFKWGFRLRYSDRECSSIPYVDVINHRANELYEKEKDMRGVK